MTTIFTMSELFQMSQEKFQASQAQEQADIAEAARLDKQEKAEKWANILAPVYAALPAELHQYVTYDANHLPFYDTLSNRMVTLTAVPHAAIEITSGYAGQIRFIPQAASRVSEYDGTHYVSYRDVGDYTDPLVAIGHALRLADENYEFEKRADELNQIAKEERIFAQQAEDGPSDYDRIESLMSRNLYDAAIAESLLLIAKHLDPSNC